MESLVAPLFSSSCFYLSYKFTHTSTFLIRRLHNLFFHTLLLKISLLVYFHFWHSTVQIKRGEENLNLLNYHWTSYTLSKKSSSQKTITISSIKSKFNFSFCLIFAVLIQLNTKLIRVYSWLLNFQEEIVTKFRKLQLPR